MSDDAPTEARIERPSVTLGTSSLHVPRLGVGTVPLGDMVGPIADEDGERVIRMAVELGAGFFDTAPQYGLGLAERRLGDVLPHLPRDEFVLATKVGRLLRRISSLTKLRGTVRDAMLRGPRGVPRLGRNALRGAKRILRQPTTARLGWPLERGRDALDSVFDFSYDGAMRSIEESLTRLAVDRLDLVLIHDPDENQEEALAGSYRALCHLREEGVIAAVGIGTNRVEPLLRMGERASFDCFLIAGRYTLLDHASLGDLLTFCEGSGTSLIIGGVYNSGMLADPRPGQLFDYQRQRSGSPWLERALRIKGICDRHGVPLPAAAIQFPLGHPAVATVLTGVKSAAELEANARLFNWPIPGGLWDDLRSEGLVSESVPVPVRAS